MPRPATELERFSVVVVTGGSSGIGLALIKAIKNLKPELRVCNLSRSEAPDFAAGKVTHFPCDLTDPLQLAGVSADLERLIAGAGPGEVLLVNNSGFGDYRSACQADRDKQLRMIDLNVRACVDLTHRLLPALLERGGMVVNVASTAAFQPTPQMATYGATKAFLLHWSLALDDDLRGRGVRALAVCPGPTRTNFFKAAGFERRPAPTPIGMTAEQVAEQALRAVAKRSSLRVNGWHNQLIVWFSSRLPKRLVTRFGGWVLRRVRT